MRAVDAPIPVRLAISGQLMSDPCLRWRINRVLPSSSCMDRRRNSTRSFEVLESIAHRSAKECRCTSRGWWIRHQSLLRCSLRRLSARKRISRLRAARRAYRVGCVNSSILDQTHETTSAVRSLTSSVVSRGSRLRLAFRYCRTDRYRLSKRGFWDGDPVCFLCSGRESTNVRWLTASVN